jgi:hypothetical protein
VERHGFRILALEADWPDAAELDRFIRQHGVWGEHSAFIHFPRWMRRNMEFAHFLKTMRRWNEGRPPNDRLELRGLDVYSLHRSRDEVLAYLDRVDPQEAAAARRRYSCTPYLDAPQEYGAYALATGRNCEDAAVDQLVALLGQRMAYTANPEKIVDPRERVEIARLTANCPTPAGFFVQRLSEGVATIAAAFYPKPVIVRMSDFKTNEYASLLGGRVFEAMEANPMIGFRGASRYAHPAYRDGFALECAAMKRVRDEMGFVNVKLMIPFCRRVDEAERVISLMRDLGLERGKDGLEIYVMCEIPNNVVLRPNFSNLSTSSPE